MTTTALSDAAASIPGERTEPSGNRYLSGAFAPVDTEVTTFDLPVEGEIPAAIDGLFVRNGPNPIEADPAMYHWFLGDGMLHGIELSGGRARSYRNRWVRTDKAAAALGEAPVENQPADTALGSVAGSVANTNVVAHAGRLLALVEVNLPTEVDSELATRGRYDFGGGLSTSMTAHPHMDPLTGEMCFFGYDVMGPPFLRYHVANAAGELVHSAEIEVAGPTMMHDFAITATRSVFMDLPVVFDLQLLGVRPFPAAWKPEYGARVGVIPRFGTNDDVVWCEIEPCYVFHVLNAYDEPGTDDVVMDVCRYETMFEDDPHGVGGGTARLERWTISPSSRKVRTEIVADLPVEFPRPDERLVGREHHVGYFVVPRYEGKSSFSDSEAISLAKIDLRTAGVEVHDFGPGTVAGEGLFVPAAADASEGEGYVLAIVGDIAGRHPSSLVVLDSQDFAGEPIATVQLPQRVPLGFHGNFVPTGTLRA
ncbi:MAG TPA: carotenoid oxygenase family protein [Acidimicrobiales bacterium]|nr:carotenoid oxygenase family protein [Acidimicrobiales bacterium]